MNSTQTRQKTLPVLIKEADAVFSEFIRYRDMVDGKIKCFICGASLRFAEAQNMHFIDRDHIPTRYDEVNCHAGCEHCNCFDPEHHEKYGRKMVSGYSQKIVMYLIVKSKGLQKYMRYELEELIASYKEKVKELKAKK